MSDNKSDNAVLLYAEIGTNGALTSAKFKVGDKKTFDSIDALKEAKTLKLTETVDSAPALGAPAPGTALGAPAPVTALGAPASDTALGAPDTALGAPGTALGDPAPGTAPSGQNKGNEGQVEITSKDQFIKRSKTYRFVLAKIKRDETEKEIYITEFSKKIFTGRLSKYKTAKYTLKFILKESIKNYLQNKDIEFDIKDVSEEVILDDEFNVIDDSNYKGFNLDISEYEYNLGKNYVTSDGGVYKLFKDAREITPKLRNRKGGKSKATRRKSPSHKKAPRRTRRNHQ